jgi:hypothetical protein
MFSTTLQIAVLSFAVSQSSPAAAYATNCDPSPTYHQLFPGKNHMLVEQITSYFCIPPAVNNVSITITLPFSLSQVVLPPSQVCVSQYSGDHAHLGWTDYNLTKL